jgi:hypothetical protein|tara:strand:+ start:842 stop:1297 length:456 start_codon:yes stop_codon:yes gene_type:complete
MTIEELEAKIADNQAKIDLKIEQAKILSDCNERIAEAQEVLNEAIAHKSLVQSYLADSRERVLESMESIVDLSNGIISHEINSEYERVGYLCTDCGKETGCRYDLGDKISISMICGDCDTIRYIETVKDAHNADGHKFSVSCRFCWGTERI